MDVLRIQQHFNEIREHEHSSRILPNSSSITNVLVSGDEKKICASGTIGHLRDESLGGRFDIISGTTNLPGVWSEPCIATKRKHEDMNPLGLDIGDVDHSPTSTHTKQPRLRSLVGEYNAAYKSQGISNKMIHGSWLELPSKLPISEACGDSDLTAEPHMAESSKSSACFDDACTLALDSGVTAAESNTTTGLRQFVEYAKNKVSDLNYPVQIKLDHEEPGDQIAEQSKDSTTEKFASFTEQHFNETEDFMQVTNRNPQTPETMASASEECCMAGIDSQSWLQLGLGIGGAKNRPHLINTKHVLHTSEDNKSRVYAGSKTDEDQLKHLLPFQSKRSLSRKDSPAFSSIYWPAAGSGSGSDADQASLPITLGSNLDKASTESAHESAICQGTARERGLKLMLVGDKISSVPSHGDYASDYTTGVPRAYLHQTGDPRSHTLNNLRSFLQLPAAGDENMPGFVRANPLQQAYQVPVPADGWTPSSQLFSEHLQLRRSSMNSRSVELHSLQNRLGSDLPCQTDKDAATATGEGGLIQKQRQILSQEWQQVAKRIGTDMHFQSILPGGMVPIGNSNPFQFTIEDLELTAMQQANYATQSRHPWSGKDFRIPSGNPLGHQIVGGYLSTSTSNIPINHMKSFNNPVNEQTSLLPPWHTSVSGSHVPRQSQRIVARNTISAENFKLTNCINDHRRPGLWFMLQASDNPSRPMDFTSLPQISKGYLRVKDEKVSVSDVKKYLANKLGVACESEVEIFCKGRPLDSSLSLQCVRDTIWFRHANSEETSDREENNICNIDPTGVFSLSNGAVMVLTYQRKIPSISNEIK